MFTRRSQSVSQQFLNGVSLSAVAARKQDKKTKRDARASKFAEAAIFFGNPMPPAVALDPPAFSMTTARAAATDIFFLAKRAFLRNLSPVRVRFGTTCTQRQPFPRCVSSKPARGTPAFKRHGLALVAWQRLLRFIVRLNDR